MVVAVITMFIVTSQKRIDISFSAHRGRVVLVFKAVWYRIESGGYTTLATLQPNWYRADNIGRGVACDRFP